MAVYEIARYPLTITLRDGSAVTLRPMKTTDCEALLEFFQRISAEERFFLKEDVTAPEVIGAWSQHLDYDRALPLLAFAGNRVVADGVLVRHRGDYRRHQAEIRVTVDPDFKAKGLGVSVMRELIEIAWDAELEQVQFEMVADAHDDAIKAAEFVGAFEAGRINDAVRDPHGNLHDVVFLRLPLGQWWTWSQF